MIIHEGELLKKHLKGSGVEMSEYANKLGMSRQNLSHHLRKEKLDQDFERKIKDILKIDFTNVKSGEKNEEKHTGKDTTLQAILKLAENNSVLIQNESRLISLLENRESKIR